MVDMQFVDSSDLESVGYDDSLGELHIRYKSSPKVYVFRGVPKQIYEELMLAGSKGIYFHSNIKRVYTDFYTM